MRGDSADGPGENSDFEQPGLGRTVLLADDDDQLREVLAMHRESRGYTLHLATNGAEALEIAQRELPEIAILDIMMPAMNGWDVARALRSGDETKSIRLLMLSGIGEEVLGPNLAILGGDVGLDKPFDLDDLDEALLVLLRENA